MTNDTAMPNSYLHEDFEHTLQDLYSAENQLVEALPKMAEAALSDELKNGFEKHLAQTKNHVMRLETIGEQQEIELKGPLGGPKMKCKGMEGLIKEGEEVIGQMDPSVGLDLQLIAAARKVEHYEMIGYEMAIRMATEMEHDTAADLLQETYDEESDTDDTLAGAADKAFKTNAQ